MDTVKNKYLSRSKDVSIVMNYKILSFQKKATNELVPTKAEFSFNTTRLWGKDILPLEAYQLDYRKLQEYYPELKQVEWVRFADIPAYRVIEGENERYIDASDTEVVALNVPQKTIEEGFRKIHGDDVKMTVTVLDKYDNYYVNLRRTLELPVYKVELDDDDHNLIM